MPLRSTRAARFVAAACAALFTTHTVRADGMPADGGVVEGTTGVSSERWGGLYIGASVGYAWPKADWQFPFDEYYNVAPNQGFTAAPDGWIGGGHVGYNYQHGALVLGLEGSLAGGDVAGKDIGKVASAYPHDSFTTDIEWITTATLRIGYALDNWLLYAKGGYAGAWISAKALSGEPGAGVTADEGDWHNGWTVSAGVERILAPNLVLGLEYGFVDLDDERHTGVTGGTSSGLPFHADIGGEVHIFSARLSFKFDPAAPAP
jgi:outer membrane immunogenic protein